MMGNPSSPVLRGRDDGNIILLLDGKTQTAIEYVYRYCSDYSAVLWVKADSRCSLLADIAELTQTLKLPEKEAQDQEQRVAAVLRRLRSHKDWLLILDNVEDLTIVDQMISMKTGYVLLTTRSQITGTFAHCIILEQMTLAEGALFLLRRAKRLAPDAPLEQASDEDQENARTIVCLLDGLPLALDQTGAYIEETACGLSDYLARYHIRRRDLLSRRGNLATDHPESVSTTFSLSFDRVEHVNLAAANLLRFCAFLDPDIIPEEIIIAAASELGLVAADLLALDEALVTLRNYSLLRRVPETRTLTIHRLVQAVLKDNMTKEEQRLWSERVVHVIVSVVPPSDEVTERNEWQRGERYYLQTLAAVNHIASWKLQSSEAEQLLHWSGSYFNVLGQYRQAEKLLLRALEIGKVLREADDPFLGEHMNNLAIVYSCQGKLAQAEHLLQETLRIQTKALGSESSDVAVCLNNLGYLYNSWGHYTQAEPFLFQARSIQEKILEPEHPDLAFSLTNLGWLYYHLGNYAQAEDLNLRALHMRENRLGPTHFLLAYNHTNLGMIYREQRDYIRAELHLQQAIQIREEALGKEHPTMGPTLHELAQLRVYQGDFDEAASLFRRALSILEQRLEPEYPDILSTRNAYAALLSKMKLYEAARAMYEKSLELTQKVDNKKYLAAALEGLANVIAAEGESVRAVQLLGVAASLREDIHVALLPFERVDYEHTLAIVCAQMSEEAFAVAWQQGIEEGKQMIKRC